MILTVTGHRPTRLHPGVMNPYAAAFQRSLVTFAIEKIVTIRPERLITGMALGWDQACASAALLLGIPFVAVLPFTGYASRWPYHAQLSHAALLEHAAEVVTLTDHGASNAAMFARDEWMVDRGHTVLALYDNSGRGDTAHTVKYANRRNKLVVNVWDHWQSAIAAAVRNASGAARATA